MPLPKSLRRPVVRRTSSSSSVGQTQRKKCRTCNGLDPRGHASTVCLDETAKEPKASLSLVLDALNLSKTKDTARGGCRFCNVLILVLDAFFEKWRGARVRINVDLKEKGTIKVSLDGERWKNEVVEIYAGSVSRTPWPTLGTAHHIPVNSGSDETFNFIRRCIQGCIANPKHTACRFSCKSSISAPKRLLDVGRASSPIRLVDTQGKSFQYVALSHCWGSATMLKTTKSNWPKLAINISFNSLPPLFQDAIIITRQLGLRFIWIDSLCIIQDSLRDWELESSKMGSIYQNSYITISATNSGDGSARCLAERRKPIKIPYENTTKKEFALRARKVLDHHPTSDPNSGPARPVGPLTFRAWALQEHVLSTRVLHYTATELLFECKSSYRCECMPDRKAYPTTPSLIPKAVASKKIEFVWQAWQRIVAQYTLRSLTVPGDKLPAISGIASKIRKATHSEYIAGLWKGNIALDLLWHASPPATSGSGAFVLDTWRAPSFSWASLDVAITYTFLDDEERETFTPTAALLASSIVPTGLNPMGAVSGGSLTLRGPTTPAILSSDQKHGKWAYTLLIKGTSSIHITNDCFLVDSSFKTEGGGKEETVRRARPSDPLRHFKACVLCLSVARYDNIVAGLVLGVSEQNPEAWERLGTFAAGTEAFQKSEEKEVILV
ncbi:HET-domain-containing protein [Cucurbitaria berberidis CBS 394.84]|uniref:HET-domain-containing protein n=1 Tax=Cucurbitaria berberidis CBS 394.84 TaxID=1168544 RepID=A0A9P4GNE1_9PLEO|nr:HET-domain-containing protein [Cucurbitaria berberidis CBS 394.84]KAF1849663.1 HET-domain-containing protein [Cucurbitaria berberidis CBS 394.84]